MNESSCCPTSSPAFAIVGILDFGCFNGLEVVIYTFIWYLVCCHFFFLTLSLTLHWTFLKHRLSWALPYFFMSRNRFQGIQWMGERKGIPAFSLILSIISRQYGPRYASSGALVASGWTLGSIFHCELKTIGQVWEAKYFILNMTFISIFRIW